MADRLISGRVVGTVETGGIDPRTGQSVTRQDILLINGSVVRGPFGQTGDPRRKNTQSTITSIHTQQAPLAELVGLNVGDVFDAEGTPRSRVRIRPAVRAYDRWGATQST